MNNFDGWDDSQILRYIKEREIEITDAKKILAERKAFRNYLDNPYAVKGKRLRKQILDELSNTSNT